MSKTIYTEIYNPNGNFLFTIDQLNCAKTNEKCLAVKCLYCDQIFYISRKQYQRFLFGSKLKKASVQSLKFCTNNCKVCYTKKQSTITKPCLYCGKLVTKHSSEAKRYPNFFCSCSCAASYNNKIRIRKKYKSSSTFRKKLKRCNVCGQLQCNYPNICKIGLLKNPVNLQKLGFNISTIGSPRVYDEWNKLGDILRQLYVQENYSITDIQRKFDIKSSRTVQLLLIHFNIIRRTPREGSRLALYNNHYNVQPQQRHVSNKSCYKHGWHITWNGDSVYYRSSYELDYCQILDRQQIKYLMENFKIPYFDSIQHKQRIAIPDFYLPDSNMIIEVKSKYTYDKQNMIDRMNAYKALGYGFKLILDHKEYNNCP